MRITSEDFANSLISRQKPQTVIEHLMCIGGHPRFLRAFHVLRNSHGPHSETVARTPSARLLTALPRFEPCLPSQHNSTRSAPA